MIYDGEIESPQFVVSWGFQWMLAWLLLAFNANDVRDGFVEDADPCALLSRPAYARASTVCVGFCCTRKSKSSGAFGASALAPSAPQFVKFERFGDFVTEI